MRTRIRDSAELFDSQDFANGQSLGTRNRKISVSALYWSIDHCRCTWNRNYGQLIDFSRSIVSNWEKNQLHLLSNRLTLTQSLYWAFYEMCAVQFVNWNDDKLFLGSFFSFCTERPRQNSDANKIAALAEDVARRGNRSSYSESNERLRCDRNTSKRKS